MPSILALLLGVWLLFVPNLARAQDSLRILVLEGPVPDWVRRVRGQLSDLPVSISTLALVVEGQPESELARQFAPLAEHRDAALVAWLTTERLDARAAPRANAVAAPGTRVAIWFARSGRFFSRPLAGPWSRLSASDRSGVLELGALSVRSAVRSLLLDPAQSEPFRELEAAANPAASAVPRTGAASNPAASGPRATAAAPSAGTPNITPASPTQNPAPANPAPTSTVSETTANAPLANGSVEAAMPGAIAESAGQGSAPNDSARPQDGPIVAPPGASEVATDRASGAGAALGGALDLSWNAELGLIGQLPGPPAHGAAGFTAGVRARSDAWAVLVLGQLGLPVRAQLGPTQVEVLQHAIFAEGQYLRWSAGMWSLGPVLRAGLRLGRRETVAGDPGLNAAAPSWQTALRLGLGWASELRWSERFGASLKGVLHWEPVRSKYELRTPEGDTVSRAQPWAVQPSLEISAIWYW